MPTATAVSLRDPAGGADVPCLRSSGPASSRSTVVDTGTFLPGGRWGDQRRVVWFAGRRPRTASPLLLSGVPVAGARAEPARDGQDDERADDDQQRRGLGRVRVQ